MPFKSAIQGPTKFQLVNILISYGSIILCGLHLLHFNNIFNFGTSKCIYIVGVFEVIRWLTNKYGFKISGTTKEGNYIASGSSAVRSNARKPTIFTRIKYIIKMSTIFTTLTIAYTFGCILMGASVTANYEETFSLAIMLTLLTIMPMGLHLGPSELLQYLSYDSFELSSRNEIALLEYLQYNALAALIGGWCGSVVSPLDWDRDWQKYPIPNMMGALLGFGLANTHTFLWLGIDLTRKNVNKGKKNL